MATATFGLEAVVDKELKNLGYRDTRIENGRVHFSADPEAICRTNLWLRTADRVRLKVGEFKATSFEELFEETKKLPWPDILPGNASFPVDGKSVKSKLFSISDCQAIVKKAVVESMKKSYKKEWFEEDGPLYKIEVSLLKDVATLTIDTSGQGLHKRGYREDSGSAPLRENLAAAMLILSRWHPDAPLIDPACGSGTIPIEAALLGKNVAPGINRHFAAESWGFVSGKLWQKARDEAAQSIKQDISMHIIGTDINNRVLKTARNNAYKAGISQFIHFQQDSLENLQSAKKYGKVISNPPYGERSGELQEAEKIYRSLGKSYKKLNTWSFYILTSHDNFEKIFGKKADKRRKLYNGNIMVNYYQYYRPGPVRRSS